MPKTLHSKAAKQLQRLLVEGRKAAGLTQTALSKKLGRPQSFVAKYETGERRLDVVEFLQVSDAIGCDPIQVIKKLRS